MPYKPIENVCETCASTYMGRRHSRYCSKSCARTRPLHERMRNKTVITAECWLWRGATNKDGYGSVRIGPSTMLAHRAAYMLAFADLPPDREVCHSCDEPACVNPEHLFLGTHNDNMRDAQSKGRMRAVKRLPNHCGLFGDALLEKVLALRCAGMSQREIATALGIGQTSVSRMLRHHPNSST